MRALCIGFGSVEALERFAQGFDGDVAGLEIDAERVHRVLEALAERDPGHIELRVGSLASIPFPDASFDLVDCTAVLHEIRNLRAAFGELTRVLTPGGEIRIVDFRSLPRWRFRAYRWSCIIRSGSCPDVHPGFGREDLLDLAARRGLREIEYRELDRPWRLGRIEALTFLLRLARAG